MATRKSQAPKIGRPRELDQARTVLVNLKVTPSERALWHRSAQLDGKLLSAWLRDAANDKAGKAMSRRSK